MKLFALDIGCGVGWHAIQYAANNPNKRIVAIEHGRVRFEKLTRRLEKHPQLKNIDPIQEDAEKWCFSNLKGSCLEEVFFLYPNPYPKPKLARQRWHNRQLMAHLVRHLMPGGKITFATNELFYAKEYKERLSALSLSLVSEKKLPNTSYPRTHFEKKYLARGDTCYELVHARTE